MRRSKYTAYFVVKLAIDDVCVIANEDGIVARLNDLLQKGPKMTIKTILAPVTDGSSRARILDTALIVARKFDAHIRVIHAKADPRDAIPYMGDGVSGMMVEDIMASAQTAGDEEAKKAKHAYEEWRKKASITAREQGTGTLGCSWHEEVGSPDYVHAYQARFADIAVVAAPTDESPTNLDLQFETMIMDSGRPLILTPEKTPASIGEKIIVGWDATAEAARAVTAAMPFLQTASSVTVLTAPESAKPDANLLGLSQYLAGHGVHVVGKTLDPKGEEIGDAILAAAEGADLLVMGAYGHSRLRELVFGGVTRYIADYAQLPVLMMH